MVVAVPTFPSGNFNIDLGVQNETTFAILENQFGDGYIQRATDGLNSNRDTWQAKYTNLTNAEATIIMDFLKERAGYKPFYWQAPGDSDIKQWTARDLKRMPAGVSGDLAYWTITATLKQEFGATIEVRSPAFLRGAGAIGGVGTIVGNAPTSLLTGNEATGIVGVIQPSKVKIVGVSATGSAGSIITGHFAISGVYGIGVSGVIT